MDSEGMEEFVASKSKRGGHFDFFLRKADYMDICKGQ
jgi:hypothetical protein